MTRLYRLLLPSAGPCAVPELYYRAGAPDAGAVEQEGETLQMPEGSSVSFDTYFGSFPYAQYRTYTQVEGVAVQLRLKGPFRVRLCALTRGRRGEAAREVLQERTVHAGGGSAFCLCQNLAGLAGEGLLYPELTALSAGCAFEGGEYAAGPDPQGDKPVRVAAVVCTFRREEYVRRNLRNAEAGFYASPGNPAAGRLDFLVVDNGGTLDRAAVENAHTRVFPNRNCGGSGGFTRGILEACRGGYTHALLMDDDILFEPELLAKTVSFLTLLKPAYREYSVAAGMLEQERPWMQHNAGFVWHGRSGKLLKTGLDLREPQSLLHNLRDEKATSCGWWYMCIPTEIPRKLGLPLPFFIKEDDHEYAMRAGSRLIFLGGVGVWHQAFSQKSTPSMEYYVKRNEMIVNALYFPRYGACRNAAKLLLAFGKRMLKGDFAAAGLLLRACDDFLQGVDFLRRTDGCELNGGLQMQANGAARHPLCLLGRFPAACLRLLAGHRRAAESYRAGWRELTTAGFWRGQLRLEGAGGRHGERGTA